VYGIRIFVAQDRTLAIDASLARILKRECALPFAELARLCVADVRARVLRSDEADPTATQVLTLHCTARLCKSGCVVTYL
jgi:hypothetical protein